MAYEYSDEIREQQAKVKREITKLAKMRVEHLISTGQMPAPNSDKTLMPGGGKKEVKPASSPSQSRIASS